MISIKSLIVTIFDRTSYTFDKRFDIKVVGHLAKLI